MPKIKELLKTQHGSHLYNLATEESDQDTYEIYTWNFKIWRPKKQAEQTIDEEDKLRISLDRFTSSVYKGVPQSLETLFSPQSKWIYWDVTWPQIQANLIRQLPKYKKQIVDTYLRKAEKLMRKDDPKKNRHAFRLLLNLGDFLDYGKMYPSLDGFSIQILNRTIDNDYVKRCENFEKDVKLLRSGM